MKSTQFEFCFWLPQQKTSSESWWQALCWLFLVSTVAPFSFSAATHKHLTSSFSISETSDAAVGFVKLLTSQNVCFVFLMTLLASSHSHPTCSFKVSVSDLWHLLPLHSSFWDTKSLSPFCCQSRASGLSRCFVFITPASPSTLGNHNWSENE